MHISQADLAALAQQVAVLISNGLADTIMERCSTRTINLAQQNGERITKLEQAVARIAGPAAVFLNNREAAKLIGIHPHHLISMRKRGEGPKWTGTHKLIRYERVEVERWLRELPTHD